MKDVFYQFEGANLDRLRVWPSDGSAETGEVFDLGEPVQLIVVGGHRPITHVYWIESFEPSFHDYYGSVVLRIWAPESDSDHSIRARPEALRKLPDMLRLAVEVARP